MEALEHKWMLKGRLSGCVRCFHSPLWAFVCLRAIVCLCHQSEIINFHFSAKGEKRSRLKYNHARYSIILILPSPVKKTLTALSQLTCFHCLSLSRTFPVIVLLCFPLKHPLDRCRPLIFFPALTTLNENLFIWSFFWQLKRPFKSIVIDVPLLCDWRHTAD